MELPNIGQHCTIQTCKQLDFLPMKCDACANIFCKDHFSYNDHSCTESYKKNNSVPECPLCSKPIPVRPGSTPDVEVGRHIDTDCQSDPAKERRGKVYSNRCNLKGCKGKELVPMICDKCQKNYCVRHRNQLDHDCKGFENTGRQGSRAGAAAVNRASNSTRPKEPAARPQARPQEQRPRPQEFRERAQQEQRERPGSMSLLQKITSYFRSPSSNERQNPRRQDAAYSPGNYQGSMSEEEALNQAIALSMSSEGPSSSSPPESASSREERRRQEEEDFALAQALSQSEEESTRKSPSSQTVKVTS